MSNYDNKKPGTGVAFPPRNGNSNGPTYKGHIILPNGEVIGVAIWEKRSQAGNDFLSISIDDREGEYQAKKLDLPLMRLGSDGQRRDTQRRDDGRDHRSYDRERGGRDIPGRDPAADRFARNDDRQRSFNDDLDDEIPF